jgi:hypothetical protein
MTRGKVLEMKRKLAEVKSGFEVRDDPWEMVGTLLDECDRLQSKVNEAYATGWICPSDFV